MLLEAVLDCLEDITGERPDPETCKVGAQAVLGVWREDGYPELGELRRRVGAVATCAQLLDRAVKQGTIKLEGALWLPVMDTGRLAPGLLLAPKTWKARCRHASQLLLAQGWGWDGVRWRLADRGTTPVELTLDELRARVVGRLLGNWPGLEDGPGYSERFHAAQGHAGALVDQVLQGRDLSGDTALDIPVLVAEGRALLRQQMAVGA